MQSGGDMRGKYVESKVKSPQWRCDGIARRDRTKALKKTSCIILYIKMVYSSMWIDILQMLQVCGTHEHHPSNRCSFIWCFHDGGGVCHQTCQSKISHRCSLGDSHHVHTHQTIQWPLVPCEWVHYHPIIFFL